MSHQIMSSTAGPANSGYFEIDNDFSSLFVSDISDVVAPTVFSVSGSAGNDGNFTVVNSTYNSGTNKTRIFVTTPVLFSTVSSGSISVVYTPSYKIDFSDTTDKTSFYITPLTINGPGANVEGTVEGDISPISASNTSLDLPGRGTVNYGELLLQNIVRMTENFSNTIPPYAPTKGQLWYDSSTDVLKLHTKDTGNQPVWTNVLVGKIKITGYNEDFVAPLQVWNIDHNLSTRNVNVQVYVDDGLGTLELTLPKSVRIIDLNTVEIEFTVPRAGKAIIIADSDNQTIPGLPAGTMTAGNGLQLTGTTLNVVGSSNFNVQPGVIDLSVIPGLIPGAYNVVTVNQYGRIVGASNVDYAAGSYLPLAGGTVTGPIHLSGAGTIERTSANGTIRWAQQDGTGRFHLYWNTTGGSSAVFENGAEDAAALSLRATNGTGGGGIFELRSASGDGKIAGDPITWTTTIRANINEFSYKGNTVLHSANIVSYVPSLTGDGASGNWNINAATASSTQFLQSLDNYVWDASNLPSIYPFGTQASFVDAAHGFPDYGGVLTSKTYSAGGGTLQLFTPYFGTDSLKYRHGDYNVNGGDSWTSWKTILSSSNFNAYAPTLTGVGASGNWNINATSATTATSVPWTGVTGKPASLISYTGFTLNANTMTPASMGFTYSLGAPWTGPIISTSTNDTGLNGYELQLNAAYSTIGMSFRTRNGDTNVWNAWSAILHSANYNSYSPTLTGVGASGTWGINITGAAETVTTPTVSYKHLGAWGVATTAVGAILVNTSYVSYTSNACSGNSYSATYLSGSHQINNIYGKISSMAMVGGDASLGSFVCRGSGAGDGNLAGLVFYNDAYAIKMGVRADGYIGIGGWSRAAWSWYSSPTGDMVAAGNVTAYSDPKLKENFQRVTAPFDILNKLDGGTFNWKHGFKHTECKAGSRDYGILANQVEEVMPEIVSTSIDIDGESYKTVAYEKMIPVLIEAVKSLSLELEELKLKMSKLELEEWKLKLSKL